MIRVLSPDLENYIRQLKRTKPRDFQKISALGMERVGQVLSDLLRREITKRGTSSSKRRTKLKDTVSHRVFARVAYAPRSIVYVNTRSRERRRPGQPRAGERLALLQGTQRRRTRAGANRGEIKSRRIVERVNRVGAPLARRAFTEVTAPRFERLFLPEKKIRGGPGRVEMK